MNLANKTLANISNIYYLPTTNNMEMSHYRHAIMLQLLENKDGLCIDSLADTLKITRTAVQQHFKVLEKDGFIKKHDQIKTNGRPLTRYVLTNAGIDYFPKQYLGFSALLLEELKEELGSDNLVAYLKKIAAKMAEKYQPHLKGKSTTEKFKALENVLGDLGFHVAASVNEMGQRAEIRAYNCIYHELARQHPEICTFDLNFVQAALDGASPEKKSVQLQSCMAKGDGHCCFKINLAKTID